MKTRKAIWLYAITVSDSSYQNSFGFFNLFATKTLYFQSEEEAVLYQEQFSPQLKEYPRMQLAIIDKDADEKNKWFLINKKEDMNDSNVNKNRPEYYHGNTLCYKASLSLKEAIKANPESVIAVKEYDKKELHGDAGSGIDCWTETTITYDCTDVIDQNTRFLYVSGKERWFVALDHEVTLTDATNLKIQNDILIIQRKTEDLLREKEQYLVAHQKKIEALQTEKARLEQIQQQNGDNSFLLGFGV